MINSSKNNKSSPIEIILRFYLLIPLCLILVFIDLWFQFGIVNSLPRVPEAWLAFNFFFNLPHIVESNILLIDKEIFDSYGKKLSIALIMAIIVTFVFHYSLKWESFLYIHSLWTLKHVVMQQFNLSHGVGVRRSILTNAWKVFGMVLGVIIYWDIYDMFAWKLGPIHLNILNFSALIFALISIGMYLNYRKGQGRDLVIGNSFLMLGGFIMYKMGAGFFAVLLIRVIHDSTGFVYYYRLNKGRREAGRSPVWYETLSSYTSDFFATIIIPILVVVTLIMLPIRPEVRAIFMVLSIMHYFSEGFTWKQDSPYRKYL